MKKLISKIAKVTAFNLIFLTFSCSSAPKRTMQINTVYKNASASIETANSAMINSNFEQAENLLESAYKSAMSIDNYDLLTTICLSYVSLYLSYETQKLENAQKYMDEAFFCADYSNSIEKNKALCSLSQIRLNLAQGKTDYNSYLTSADKAMEALKKDLFYEGIINSIKGDIYRQQKKYENSYNSYIQAALIFTKNCYLGEIGITWYKAAQVSSLNGNKKEALNCIEKAIKYDRDSENSIALGTDYYAQGIILLKGNHSQEETQKANYSFTHAAQIFSAIGMEAQANKSLNSIIQ